MKTLLQIFLKSSIQPLMGGIDAIQQIFAKRIALKIIAILGFSSLLFSNEANAQCTGTSCNIVTNGDFQGAIAAWTGLGTNVNTGWGTEIKNGTTVASNYFNAGTTGQNISQSLNGLNTAVNSGTITLSFNMGMGNAGASVNVADGSGATLTVSLGGTVYATLTDPTTASNTAIVAAANGSTVTISPNPYVFPGNLLSTAPSLVTVVIPWVSKPDVATLSFGFTTIGTGDDIGIDNVSLLRCLTEPVPTASTIANACPIQTVNLTTLQPAAVSGLTYEWRTANTSTTGTALTSGQAAAAPSSGTYYLYSKTASACYSPASTQVLATNECTLCPPAETTITGGTGNSAATGTGSITSPSGTIVNFTLAFGSTASFLSSSGQSAACGIGYPANIAYTGNQGGSGATITYTFNKPLTSIVLYYYFNSNAGQTAGETVTYTTNAGVLPTTSINNYGSCSTVFTASGNQVTGSTLLGNAQIKLTSTLPFTTITIAEPGANGSASNQGTQNGGTGTALCSIGATLAPCAAGTAQVALASTTLSACSPNTVNLNTTFTGTAPIGSSLVWFNNATHTLPRLTNAEAAAVATSGTYYGFFYDTVQDCYNTASSTSGVVVTISSTPAITVSSTNPISCGAANGTITISGLVAGVSYTTSYALSGTTTVIPAQNASGIGTITISGLLAGSYTAITATSVVGGCTSNALTATLTNPLVPTTPGVVSGPSCIASVGGVQTFSVPSDPAFASYNWTYSGTGANIVSGQGTNSIDVTFTANASTGNFKVEGLTACNSTFSYFVLNRSTILVNGPAALCPAGGNVILTAAPASTYQWYLNGNLIGGATDQRYTVPTAGSYTMMATYGACNSIISDAFVVAPASDVAPPVFDSNLLSAVETIDFDLETATLQSSPATYGSGTASVIIEQTLATTMEIVAGPTTATTPAYNGNVNGKALFLTGDLGNGTPKVLSMNFPQSVYNLKFSIFNIDGSLPISFRAYKNGVLQPIEITNLITSGAKVTVSGSTTTMPSVVGVGGGWNFGTPGTGRAGVNLVFSTPIDNIVMAFGSSISIESNIYFSDISFQHALPVVLPGDVTVTCDAIPVALVLTATDNCGGTTVVNYSQTPTVYVPSATQNTIIRTWSTTDGTNTTLHTQTITVNPSATPANGPTITPTTSAAFCAGGNVLLTSSATTDNQWYKDDVAILGATNQTFTATQSGSYTVTGISGTCRTAKSAATVVTENALPATPAIGTITQPTCAVSTGSVALSNLPSGAWIITTVPATVATNGSGTTTTISGLAAGTTYKFIVSNVATTCTSAASADAIINTAPTIPATPGAITGLTCITPTPSAQTYSVPNVPGVNYTWLYTGSLGGGSVTASTTNSYNITFGLSATSGNITVKATNSCGESTLSILAITIVPTPSVTSVGESTICPAGGSILLTSTPAPAYQWYKDGTILTGEINQTYTATTTGDYTIVTSSGSCVSVASATFNVIAQDTTAPMFVSPLGTASKTVKIGFQSLSTIPIGLPQTFNNIETGALPAEKITFRQSTPGGLSQGSLLSLYPSVSDSNGPAAYGTGRVLGIRNSTPNPIRNLVLSFPTNASNVRFSVLDIDGNSSSNPVGGQLYLRAYENGLLKPITVKALIATSAVPPINAYPDASPSTTPTITSATGGRGLTSVIELRRSGINVEIPGPINNFVLASVTQSQSDYDIFFSDVSYDYMAPILPGNVAVNCDAIPEPVVLTATDNCGTASVDYTQMPTVYTPSATTQIITRTWTATDGVGNTTSHIQTITVNPASATPVVEANQSFCATPYYSLANVVITGTDVKWYADAITTTVLPLTTLLVNGATYFATQTMGGNCESPRVSVTVELKNCARINPSLRIRAKK